jgi:hypothetical protein
MERLIRLGIPTGFRPQAQGCEVGPSSSDRATLGHRPPNIPNRNAVAAHPVLADSHQRLTPGHNAVGVVSISERAPKVAPKAFEATLGWKSQSLWDYLPVHESKLLSHMRQSFVLADHNGCIGEGEEKNFLEYAQTVNVSRIISNENNRQIHRYLCNCFAGAAAAHRFGLPQHNLPDRGNGTGSAQTLGRPERA